MKIYRIPMVPGPVSVSREVLEAGQENFGSADLEKEYIELYKATENRCVKSCRRKIVSLYKPVKGCWRFGVL